MNENRKGVLLWLVLWLYEFFLFWPLLGKKSDMRKISSTMWNWLIGSVSLWLYFLWAWEMITIITEILIRLNKMCVSLSVCIQPCAVAVFSLTAVHTCRSNTHYIKVIQSLTQKRHQDVKLPEHLRYKV